MSADWRLRAACRGEDALVFFGVEGEKPRARQRREAQAGSICATCPVTSACLEFALETDQAFGTWGGMSPGERQALRPGRPALCRSGQHRMTPENTYVYPNGWKTCRACKAAGEQQRRVGRAA